MNIPLDPWQKQALAHRGDLLLCTGRRVGKTYILARKAIDYMAKHPGIPIIIVSLTEEQAMIIMSMALYYARENYPKLVGRGKKKPTRLNLHFNRGVMKIRAVGNTGDSARGYEGGILIVDEASRMPSLFWLAAQPILITTNGHIWMCSTLFGTDNYFYKRFAEAYYDKKPDARFKVIVETTEHMIATRPISSAWTKEQKAGAKRILKEHKEEWTEAQYAQEYLAIADISLKQYFSDELIRSRMTIKKWDVIGPPIQRDRFMGVDVARHGEDKTVLLSVKRINRERIEQIGCEILPKMRLDQQADRIKGLNQQHNYRKIYVDTTGMGWGVFDCLLADSKTKSRVVSMENVKKTLDPDDPDKARTLKNDMYENLLKLMQTGKIDLFDEDNLFQSLKSVQYEYKDNRIKIFGSNTHIAEALVRAAWSMQDKTLDVWAA